MKRIIVVEDDIAILEMMQAALELSGYDVQPCENGAALQAALHNVPDLIFLDVHLGQEDGRTLCRQVKTDERTQRVPIILCSACISPQEVLMGSPANDFLEKPFRLHELLKLAQQYTSANHESTTWSTNEKEGNHYR